MKLSTLQALILIEAHGSIRAAAQKMHVSQPALTAAIQQLESELEAPLLLRSKQGATFTPFGRALLQHAKLIVAQAQRANEEVAQLRGHWSGTIRMAVSPAIGLGLLPQALHQFAQQYPQVTVECRDGLYPGITPLLRDGTLDVALTPVHRMHLEPDLVAEPLYESHVVIVAQRSHPLAQARSLAQLHACEWVLSSPAGGPGALIEEAFAQAGLPAPRIRLLCESFLALPAVIAASDGWMTTMPSILFDNCAAREQLCVVPIEDALPRPVICSVQRHDMPLTPAARQLIAWVQHYALQRLKAQAPAGAAHAGGPA